MMWNPSVNAICERAHGTGSTALTAAAAAASWSTEGTTRLLTRTGATACGDARPGGRGDDIGHTGHCDRGPALGVRARRTRVASGARRAAALRTRPAPARRRPP